jgi:hypothetical protein
VPTDTALPHCQLGGGACDAVHDEFVSHTTQDLCHLLALHLYLFLSPRLLPVLPLNSKFALFFLFSSDLIENRFRLLRCGCLLLKQAAMKFDASMPRNRK